MDSAIIQPHALYFWHWGNSPEARQVVYRGLFEDSITPDALDSICASLQEQANTKSLGKNTIDACVASNSRIAILLRWLRAERLFGERATTGDWILCYELANNAIVVIFVLV
jgi:hypothetical protein